MANLDLVRRPTMLARVRSVLAKGWHGPFSAKDPTLARLLWDAPPSVAGVSVTEASALSSSAVWSAVTMIADDLASLPLNLYKRLPTGGKDRFETHPLYRLLHDAPNPEMDSMVWRRTMQTHALIWQNAYAEIERDTAGRPVAIWPLVPERVSVYRDQIYGALKYRIMNSDGGEVLLDPENVIHLVGYSHDGTLGSSLVQKARESIALGLAAEKFGAAFFGNGSTFGGVVAYKGPRPNDQVQKETRDTLNARHQGVERAHKILALYNDATFTRVGIPPNEGQFNETRLFQIREIARWFKIPPHKLGDLADATYSNVEQMDAAYLSSCVRPWLKLWEQQLSRKLIARQERSIQFIEHDTHGFLSVDAAGRAALYTAEFNIGALTPNEIRSYENRDPIDGGDNAYVNMAMIPIARVDEWIDAQIKAKAPPPPPAPAPVPVPPTDQQMAAFIGALETRLEADAAALLAEQQQIAEKAALEAAAAALRAELLEAKASAAARDAQLLEAAGAAELAGRLEAERQAAEAEARRLERETQIAEAAELRAEAEAARAGLAEQKAAAAALAERLLATETARALAEEHASALVERATALEAERRAAIMDNENRLEAIARSHRALILDAVNRLLAFEAGRATRAQATPEKLRAWLETFYQTRAEACRAIYRPAILAWAAYAGLEAEAALEDVVAAHIEQSRRELRAVAEHDDPEELAAALARLIRRWEAERAPALADRLMAEGDRHGH